MNEEKVIAYLKKKDREPTKEEVQKVMKQGKIYGDPLVILNE